MLNCKRKQLNLGVLYLITLLTDSTIDRDFLLKTLANYFSSNFIHILLLLYVPNLWTLDDTAALHLSLSIAILVALSYLIPFHSLMLSYQLILGRPLPLFPSIFPSNSVLYMLFSRIKCPKYFSFLSFKILISFLFSFIL